MTKKKSKKNPLLLSAASIGMEKLIELGINKSLEKMSVKPKETKKPSKPKNKKKNTTLQQTHCIRNPPTSLPCIIAGVRN
jgi:hypothetical protein